MIFDDPSEEFLVTPEDYAREFEHDALFGAFVNEDDEVFDDG